MWLQFGDLFIRLTIVWCALIGTFAQRDSNSSSSTTNFRGSHLHDGDASGGLARDSESIVDRRHAL